MIFSLVVCFLIFSWILDWVSEYLNVRHFQPELPAEFDGYYDAEKYKKSQLYLKETTRFGIVTGIFDAVLILAFIFLGGFNAVDVFIRELGYSELMTGVVYLGVLSFANTLLSLPFSIYSTFVIEKKFGFNKTTVKTFVTDLIKGLLLTLIIGAPLLMAVLWFFETMGSNAWLYVWIFIAVFQLIMLFLAPVVIMPLFNKFEPLEDGELKEKITTYAEKENFSLKGVYTMDGSKRSTKSNAFFTGFGKFRRIVLFDTLIEKHTADELLVVLAHEMGHFKKKHIFKMIVTSILMMGVTLYFLQLALNFDGLFTAFGVETKSTHIGLLLFSLLFIPINMITGFYSSYKSRKHEFEADQYAVKTTGLYKEMIDALKKLSVDNLSNLTPHWLKVVLEYSHPPVLERIKALKALQK